MKSAISITAVLVVTILCTSYFIYDSSIASAKPEEPHKFCYIYGHAAGYTSGELYNQGVLFATTEINPQDGYFKFGLDVGCYTQFTVVVLKKDCSATMNNVTGADCPVNLSNVPYVCW